jgi:hypothetical protein
MAAMARPGYFGLCATVALAMLALPALALADARVSRSGNTVTLTSDSRGDDIANAGTDNRRLISFVVDRGNVLVAGPGCVRLRGPRVRQVIVTCGAPSRTHVNAVALRVDLGGGDDSFVAAPWDDVQPRLDADGGSGNDTIYGSTNADDIAGGAGDDKLFGLDDADSIDGGDGADVIVGGAGDDGLVGGAGSDRVYGDEQRPTSGWGNDTIVTALDFAADRIGCGEGGGDATVLDLEDLADSSCENLAGGQSTPPRDSVGTLPLAVTIGALAPPPGGLARVLRGQPIRLPVTFSAAAQIRAELTISGAEASRLGVPGRERILADDIGTPLTLIPLTLNTQMRLRWPVREYLAGDNLVRATLTIDATDVNGATTTATKAIVLRR